MMLRCESDVSETNALAGTIPEVFNEAVVDRPTAVTPVKLAPLIAGNAPVNFYAVTADNA